MNLDLSWKLPTSNIHIDCSRPEYLLDENSELTPELTSHPVAGDRP
jgi:hypothetical protein